MEVLTDPTFHSHITPEAPGRLKRAARRVAQEHMPEILIANCKWIPLRLTLEERQLLEVLENALNVSDYTDTVDVFSRSQKRSRIFEGLRDVLSIASGLMVSNNLKVGEELMGDNNLDDNIPFFRNMFEVGRRYKIMNPSRMRDTYGKMMFMLQDTVLVGDELGDTFIKKIQTVYSFLQKKDQIKLLSDPLVWDATQSIDGVGLSREELEELVQAKAQAAKGL